MTRCRTRRGSAATPIKLARQKKFSDDRKRRKDDNRNRDKWNRRCINPKFDGKHKIEDCPNTPEDQKKPMFDTNMEKIKKRKKVPGMRASNGDESLTIEVIIGGEEMQDREVTGADTKIIPDALLEKLLSSSSLVEVCELEDPVEIELEVQDEALPKVIITREIRTALTLIIPGSRFPVAVRNARMRVRPMAMKTLLLDRDLLDHLVFNCTGYLKDNYEKVKDTDAIVKEKCGYADVTYTNEEDDPIAPQADLSEQFENDTRK